MTVTVRFAPSPTGHIHIGNARTALFNWLFSRAKGGRFVLRYDDTDRERSRPEFAEAIAEDLTWLGIRPDDVIRQSERLDRYEAAKATLVAEGLLYPCYESADELDLKRRRQRLRNLPPVYDRAALALSDDDKARLEAEGRRPHWRFKLPGDATSRDPDDARHVRWTDLCKGPMVVDLASLSDPVLVREDGSFLYTLPSIVDDIDMGVTHVIRGEDHVTNTGVQIAIFRALGGTVPGFGHHNLLTDALGEGLSKRKGALSIRSLRAEGIEPQAVAALAVRLGTSEPAEPVRDIDDLATSFDLAATSRSAAKFDEADLRALTPGSSATCRSKRQGRGWRRSAYRRGRRSGRRCRAISNVFPILPTGGVSSPARPSGSRPSTTRRFLPVRPNCSRTIRSTAAPGGRGRKRWRKTAGARARPCSCRCASRSRAVFTAPNSRACCRSWAGRKFSPVWRRRQADIRFPVPAAADRGGDVGQRRHARCRQG
ncbi:Glutamate--tRNA ligase [Methylobrevis pamukkalensis]|uniref:Glutamate--tRNA ligase n=1 Tax=Methylobrevis pamukkalensis TaxID=1439726 RepID=A0A1E3H516_9HYPH|nr:Glutamate--tRNA ligase [Methylobrevis pamukkalensis]